MCLKVEAAMASAEIDAKLVCPLRIPAFPPGTHNYNPKRHNLIEGVNKCMISRPEAQAKFREYQETLGSHDEVFTDGTKMNERVGAAAVINRHFQNGDTTCRHLTKRLPDNSTIFAAEAAAITLALNYYQHMGPVQHDVIVYSDSMSCLQAIEGEDTENPFICHIMNLLWLLNDKGTHIRFCWIPSHCGIDGNEWKSWPAGEGDPWPWHRSSGGCPLCRSETTGQLLHPAAGSNQVGCSCTWQRSLFRKTNTGATEEIPALNQSWKSGYHPTSHRPYKGHQVPYLVPRTTDYLSPLWSNTDHWPYAPGVCSVTGMSWWIPHSWLIE